MGQFDLCKRDALARGPASCMATGHMPRQLNMGPKVENSIARSFSLAGLGLFFMLLSFNGEVNPPLWNILKQSQEPHKRASLHVQGKFQCLKHLLVRCPPATGSEGAAKFEVIMRHIGCWKTAWNKVALLENVLLWGLETAPSISRQLLPSPDHRLALPAGWRVTSSFPLFCPVFQLLQAER